MTMPGQFSLDGSEEADPRIDKAARALYLEDVKRRHQAGDEVAKAIAKSAWPKVEHYYVAKVRLVLATGGFQ